MAEEVKKSKTKGSLLKLLKFSTWLTGIVVSLMMGFAMVNKYIIVPKVPILAVIIAGWAVIVTTVLNVVLSLVLNIIPNLFKE